MSDSGAEAGEISIARGHFYEDFEPGRRFDHRWSRTMFVQESIDFSTSTLAFNQVFVNTARAQMLGYREIPINPLLTFSVVLGLSVEDLSEAGGPFLGLEELEFGLPVYDRDTISASSSVVRRRLSKSRPGWGTVSWRTIGVNQDGDEVVRYLRTNLARVRKGSSDA